MCEECSVLNNMLCLVPTATCSHGCRQRPCPRCDVCESCTSLVGGTSRAVPTWDIHLGGFGGKHREASHQCRWALWPGMVMRFIRVRGLLLHVFHCVHCVCLWVDVDSLSNTLLLAHSATCHECSQKGIHVFMMCPVLRRFKLDSRGSTIF